MRHQWFQRPSKSFLEILTQPPTGVSVESPPDPTGYRLFVMTAITRDSRLFGLLAICEINRRDTQPHA
jgi:hypothetical protein